MVRNEIGASKFEYFLESIRHSAKINRISSISIRTESFSESKFQNIGGDRWHAFFTQCQRMILMET
jgi:hypothetical protein